jgi:D-cysteine desulfhydrase
MSPDAPALFRAWPELSRRCPRFPFTRLPTPVEAFPVPGGPDELWIKRDDRCCPLYGGNKPRKLEFVIGAARARGSRRLVTSGAIGTHHGLATTILGREAGLATTLVLVPQPVTDGVRRAVARHAAFGAEIVFAASVPEAALRGAAAFARSALRGERPWLVPTGGSSATGNLGFVSAGLELALQVKAGAAPAPREIWLAVGTGGTLAGLVVGLRLAGLATRVVGVVVTDILTPSARSLARAAGATARRLRRLGVDVPGGPFGPREFELVGDCVGAGYGAPTASGRRAVRAAAACDVALEDTYTGKALGALLDRAPDRAPRGPVLFWNTHNGVDVDARLPDRSLATAIPPRLARLLAGPDAAAAAASARGEVEQHVRGRDQADELLALHHRQAADLVLGHEQRRPRHRRRRLHHDGRLGHGALDLQ